MVDLQVVIFRFCIKDENAILCLNLYGEELGYLKRDMGGVTPIGEQYRKQKIIMWGNFLEFTGKSARIEFAVLTDFE